MGGSNYQKLDLNEIADDIIDRILENRKDPFEKVRIVCHNSRVLQWFKAYFLKTHKEVMMNVDFETLSVFLNGIINPDNEKIIINKSILRDFIIKELLQKEKYFQKAKDIKELGYIFKGEQYNGTNLYEFTDKLASLFLYYEFDEENISEFGWQFDLYKAVLETAKKENCYTTKELFDENGSFVAPEGQVYIINNSFVTSLFRHMINDLCGVNVYFYEINDKTDFLTKDKDDRVVFDVQKHTKPSVYCAPNTLREIEELHSRICKVIQEDDNNKDNVRFSDFLVYAPDINKYSSAISRVFNQDGTNYPRLPYRIAGEITEKRQINNALDVLFDIANKQFFTRNDFHKIIKNPMIQIVNGFTDKDASMWMDIVIATNTHRNAKNSGKIKDDWDYLKKRLLVSVLVSDSSSVENIVTFADKTKCLPYSYMDLDNSSMCKMLDIIEKLGKWNKLFDKDLDQMTFDKSGIENVKSALDSLLSLKRNNGSEKNYLYREVVKELDQITRTFESIPATTLMLLLKDAPSVFSSNPEDMFTSGVTFMNLNCDDVVSAKNVFVMGLSSKNFPRVTKKNEIDYSNNHKTSEELDDLSIRNIIRNSKKVTFSYVYCDTKTDEPFYPSPLLTKYGIVSSEKDKSIVKVSLDENRKYSELFTLKEFRDKEYYLGLSDVNINSDETNRPDGRNQSNRIEVTELKTSDLKKFLTNTLVYQYEFLIKKEDDEDEKITSEYELIDEDPLERYNTIKQMIMSENDDLDEDALYLEQKLPGLRLEEDHFSMFKNGVVDIIRNHTTLIGTPPSDSKYHELELEPLEMKMADGRTWTLNKNAVIFKKVDNDGIHYIEPKDYILRDIKDKDYLHPYIVSLMDIAGKTGDTHFNVCLCSNPYPYPYTNEKHYSITPEEAKELLCKMYDLMTDFSKNDYMDFEFLKENVGYVRRNVPSLSKMINEMYNAKRYGHSSWKNSSIKDQIDLGTDLGYGIYQNQNDLNRQTDVQNINENEPEILFVDQFIDRWNAIRSLIKYDLE